MFHLYITHAVMQSHHDIPTVYNLLYLLGIYTYSKNMCQLMKTLLNFEFTLLLPTSVPLFYVTYSLWYNIIYSLLGSKYLYCIVSGVKYACYITRIKPTPLTPSLFITCKDKYYYGARGCNDTNLKVFVLEYPCDGNSPTSCGVSKGLT